MFGYLNNLSDHEGRRPSRSLALGSADNSAGRGADFDVRKVLVVDDEHDIAELAELLLSSHGFDVLVAFSAQEALQILAKDNTIDAVFSDIVMPGMSGLELADQITASYPHVKIVLTSGYAQPAQIAGRPLRYLCTPKPYRIDTVLRLLRT